MFKDIYIYICIHTQTHTYVYIHTHMYRYVQAIYDKGLYITDNNDKYRDSIAKFNGILAPAIVQDAGFYITKTQRSNKSTRHSTALKSRACSAVHYVNSLLPTL
jgi:hypothetical protein